MIEGLPRGRPVLADTAAQMQSTSTLRQPGPCGTPLQAVDPAGVLVCGQSADGEDLIYDQLLDALHRARPDEVQRL
ncbi:unnamed protein product, partial [Effrenium voratum]